MPTHATSLRRSRTPGKIESRLTVGTAQAPTYATAVLADTPVGYWKLTETIGTIAIDSSGNSNNGTYTGGYTLGTTAPGNLGNGITVDGSSGYVSIPDSSLLKITNKFALELWFKPSNLTQNQTYIFSKGNDFAIVWEFIDNTLEIFSSGNDIRSNSQIVLNNNDWVYLVYDYDGTTLKGFVNGVEKLSIAKNISLPTSTQPLRIGNTFVSSGSQSANFVNASFAHVAVYNKSIANRIKAHYDAAQAPTPTDPYFDKTTLLLHFDGANNSTSFVDVKGKTVTPYGDAKISTVQSKFGGASGYFDGNGDYLTIPSSTDFSLSNLDFTIESWIYPTIGGQTTIIERRSTGFGSGDWAVFYQDGKIEFAAYDIDSFGNGVLTSTSNDTPLNTWTHFAISRNGNTWQLFINGSIKDTKTYSQTIADNNQPLTIGRDAASGGRFYYGGYIDDLRLTNGQGRYTQNFTAPTSAFPDSAAIA